MQLVLFLTLPCGLFTLPLIAFVPLLRHFHILKWLVVSVLDCEFLKTGISLLFISASTLCLVNACQVNTGENGNNVLPVAEAWSPGHLWQLPFLSIIFHKLPSPVDSSSTMLLMWFLVVVVVFSLQLIPPFGFLFPHYWITEIFFWFSGPKLYSLIHFAQYQINFPKTPS